MSAPSLRFDLRKLELLSNTIFGVAMTLLATDLPKIALSSEAGSLRPIAAALLGRFIVVALSFAIAAIFWLSHYRRLALEPSGSNLTVALNLAFLFCVVLPPTNLYGGHPDSVIAMRIYTTHLIFLAGFNAALWRLKHHPIKRNRLIG